MQHKGLSACVTKLAEDNIDGCGLELTNLQDTHAFDCGAQMLRSAMVCAAMTTVVAVAAVALHRALTDDWTHAVCCGAVCGGAGCAALPSPGGITRS